MAELGSVKKVKAKAQQSSDCCVFQFSREKVIPIPGDVITEFASKKSKQS